MKKYTKYAVFAALFGFAALVACEKDEVIESADDQVVQTDQAEDDQTRAKVMTAPYNGECGYCWQKTKVCISPTSDESWACWDKEGGWFFRTLNLSYLCDGGGVYQQIPLITITNSTPLETQCFYVDLPLNTEVYLTSNSGCAHDYLCDIDVTFTTAPWKGSTWNTCVTEATYDSNGGEFLSIADRESFEICSRYACFEELPHEVKKD
ncbi:MAG: hypothetical protein ACI8ZM_000751 [Crocinitomix sp.]|jgi:hypothetical protein